jgi:hypothetical protein
VVVFLPELPGETTVILMLGGVQDASSVIFRDVLGICDGFGGTAFARQVELRIDRVKMSVHMVGTANSVVSWVNELTRNRRSSGECYKLAGRRRIRYW